MNEPLVRDILRVLCRIPIQRGQLVMYRFALQHRELGFTSTQIREALGYDQAQHRGLMAALAVRINDTPLESSLQRRPGVDLFLRRKFATEYTYWPRGELVEAIERLPALALQLGRPLEELLTAKPVSCALPASVPSTVPLVVEVEPPVAASSAFDGLLDALDKAELVFPPEIVANLLLALQVKRFVILTGISGTGKTRIAQTLAARFPLRRKVQVVAPPPDDGAVITVMPYMLKHRRMILPQALATQIPGLAQPGSTSLHTRWPGGAFDLNVYVGTGAQVMFRGGMRAWFLKTYALGDKFPIHLEGPPDGPPDTLVFGPRPAPAVHEEVVKNSAVVAVRPDWTDHRGLLGGYNPLIQQYLTTPFLELLLRAADEHSRAEKEKRDSAPFFLILDEMNLARVEHYFSDFLSAIESGDPLSLHDSPEIEEGLADESAVPIPRRLTVPPNLFFVGTVNVDESTYLFSPKVLDRAFAIELNTVDLDGLSTGVPRGGELVLAAWDGRLPPPARPGRADWQWLVGRDPGLADQVRAFHRCLARRNRHFGYRVATEVARFVRLAVDQSEQPEDAAWAALDLALLQKVLVKLHGTRHELDTILKALLQLALVGAEGVAGEVDLDAWRYVAEEAQVRPRDEAAERAAVFPRSAAKLWRMRDRLVETGFTSWIE